MTQTSTARNLPAMMAQASMADHGLPYSLLCDAWDLLFDRCGGERGVTPTATVWSLNEALALAVDAYEADPAGYRFNDAAK